MIVAEITKDHLWDKSSGFTNQVGKQFGSQALRNWWGWADDYNENYFELALDVEGKTTFKLYDDDGELYYEGWLIDDQDCMVQQFVLGWAEKDSGCTVIKVFRPSNILAAEGNGSYVQEIG